jgi:Rap1a immunity proteins
MIGRIVAIGAALALSLSPALANDTNVQSLYDACRKGEGTQEFALCVGYVSGIGDMLQVLGSATKEHPDFQPFAICGDASYGAMTQAFINWVQNNPREWTESRLLGVVRALRENWPCPAK